MWQPPETDQVASSWQPPEDDRQDPNAMSLGGLASNAVSDVADIAKSIPSSLYALSPKKMFIDTPRDVYQSGKQMLQGGNFSDTPMGQQSGQAISMVKNLPQNVMHPYDHPVKAAMDVAAVASPFMKGSPMVDLGQDAVNGVYQKVVPPLLKSTKGIPTNVSRITIDKPSIMDLPGTSESIQGKSQDIINSIKEAQRKVGGEFGQAYKDQGMDSPVDQIISGDTPYKSKIANSSYETLGDPVQRQQTIPANSYRSGGTPQYAGINPTESTGEIPGESVNIPARSYTYSEEGPNKVVSNQNVADTVRSSFQPKSFDELRSDYHNAVSGDLFKQKGIAGGFSETPTIEKLSKLTELKRALQNEAIYPQPGQQLSPSQGARNAAIKQMASHVDQLRGQIPGGEKLAQADDAFVEMNELKHRLMSDFKDPYKGQDYLNRILKGNTDWLTSGRMAGKVGAIERIEQITGNQVLKPALEEMAAAYIKNPDTMGLPSTGLKSIITALVPAKMFLKPLNVKTSMFSKPGRFGAAYGGATIPNSKQAPESLFKQGTQSDQSGDQVQPSYDPPANQPNNNGDQQRNQNNQNSNVESSAQHPGIITQAKTLTKEIARKFLDMANGSKELARELARKAGHTF